jgi:hypothetical protein
MIKSLGRLIGSGGERQHRPLLSIVVIVFDMPDQAENTLLSLSPEHQIGVCESDYEVVVVENESSHCLSAAAVEALPGNFYYYRRCEVEPTPVHAINFGARHCRGRHICIVIDGARLLTPGAVKNILLGHRLHERAVVTVPGYHIGHQLQQEAIVAGYGVEQERALMRSIAWPSEGYRLFEIACFSGSSARGFFLPSSESNCISMPRSIWDALGGMDPAFNLPGGGLANLDLYKRACEHPGVCHVILPGEGTFHQFHSGATTGGESGEARDKLIREMQAQYRELRGADYQSPVTQPIFLGEIGPHALRFVRQSATLVLQCPEEVPETA